jgi:hypothetical protein
MAFSRDELTARHPLATEPISLPPPHSIQQAVELEKLGNWHLAGESYSQLEQQFAAALDIDSRAKLLARSGTCFEIAWQPRPAARAYSDAARLLATSDVRLQVAAELFNRAARQHFAADEFFEAGTSWRAAAGEFQKLGNALIRSNDNIPPIPFSAAGHTICGACLIAAGDAFLLASGEEVSACGACWEAGNAYAQAHPSPNSHAFNAYRKALNATIRFYRTLELERLRLTLPLTDEERAAKLDPLKVLEEATFRGNYHHQPPLSEALRSARARLETNRQLAAPSMNFHCNF